MEKKHNKELNPYIKKLRKNMTATERKLWYCFLRNYPVKFYRQRIMGEYIVDFYCSKAKVIIEVDGYFHYAEERIPYERRRTEYLNSLNFKVLRFTNANINEDFEDVCRIIDNVIRSRVDGEIPIVFDYGDE